MPNLLTAGATAQDLPRLSAYSLGVFQDCPRKYALRYRQNRYWPAPEGKVQDLDSRKRLERGQRFHALVQAHQEGLPIDSILSVIAAEDEAIAPLWAAFLAHPDSRPEGEVWSEVPLHFFVKDVPVMARFDRIVRHDGHWSILDWKTGGSLDTLSESWQTKLYPFALAHAGHVLNEGEPIPPEAVTLRYWVWKGDRVEPLSIPYSAERYAADLATFEQQAGIVSAPLDDANFPGHGPGSRACARCQFLTLCHPMPLPEPQAPELPLPRFSGVEAPGGESQGGEA
ncbi:PD-(D/E)XK nuclease superfamily protein [compost metagenome]